MRSEGFCQNESLLLKHLEAVTQHNKVKNLTSITDREAGKVLHIGDALAVLPEVNSAPEGLMADIGSGAGYPGIPLALSSGRRTVLIEAQKKKAEFLQAFLEEQDLTDRISVCALRSEELALTQGSSFAVVTARAVAELPVLLELAAPLLMQGGHFIGLKGRPKHAELERGLLAAEKLGLVCEHTRTYSLKLDGTNHERQVLVFVRREEAGVVLPRRPGMAAKRPLA